LSWCHRGFCFRPCDVAVAVVVVLEVVVVVVAFTVAVAVAVSFADVVVLKSTSAE